MIVVLMGVVGSDGFGYRIPLMMSCTSVISARSVKSTVPFKIASQYSLSANGPNFSAIGPDTKGVFAAWLK
jgi:hypothetical protein